jgi:hypothetical protein
MASLTCFITKFLDTDDIDMFAKENSIIKPFYLGCYPANVQPKGVKNKCCWVWNTDENDQPGTHWICIVKDMQNIIYFDSFGKTPIFFKRKYWWIIFAVYVAILQCTHNYSGSRLLVGHVAYGV